MTDTIKAWMASKTPATGLSMGKGLRCAAASCRPAEDDTMFDGMIGLTVKTTAAANAAIDDALAFVEASNKRIKALETG